MNRFEAFVELVAVVESDAGGIAREPGAGLGESGAVVDDDARRQRRKGGEDRGHGRLGGLEPRGRAGGGARRLDGAPALAQRGGVGRKCVGPRRGGGRENAEPFAGAGERRDIRDEAAAGRIVEAARCDLDRAVRHIGQQRAGEMRAQGDVRGLVGARLLDHLHQHGLAFPEACGRIEKGRPRFADLDARRAQVLVDPDDAAHKDVAGSCRAGVADDAQLDRLVVLAQRRPHFAGRHRDQQLAAHGA